MKYVALIRGINVGGNSIVKMDALKKALEANGYTNVTTYINSGNVVFESPINDHRRLETELESIMQTAFHIPAKVVVRNRENFLKTLAGIPKGWGTGADYRCYLAFIKEPVTATEVTEAITPKEGVDFMSAGPGVVYMWTKMSGLTKSGFTKLVGTKVYQSMTMRNLNTVRKLAAMLSS